VGQARHLGGHLRSASSTLSELGGDDRQHDREGSPRRRGSGKRGLTTVERAAEEAIGVSRGGRSTKIHGVTDHKGRLRRFHLTGGHRHDLVGADPLLLEQAGTGPLLADKAYDAKALRAALEAQGREVVIPPKANAVDPAPYDEALYKERNWIERAFGRLKDYRRIATRYDKLARNFAAAIALVATRMWFMI